MTGQVLPDGAVTITESPYEMGKRLFVAGIREFASGGYFEAHDLWEEFWQELRGPDRLFLQGLIHLAVGTYHHANGNLKGAESQLQKAATKLAGYPDGHWGVSRQLWIQWAQDIASGRDAIRPCGGLPFDESRFPTNISMAPR